MSDKDDAVKLPAPVSIARPIGTKAATDQQLLDSWIANLTSPHSKQNFGMTARRFLAELETQSLTLRTATVEEVRDAINAIAAGQTLTSARQTMLRVKSLLSYGHRLGYLQFNAGAVLKAPRDTRSIAQRIISEVEMGLLIRSTPSRRDRILIEVGYAGGLRVSELVGLSWSNVIARADGNVQLDVVGKGNKVRQVLLPDAVGRSLLSLRGSASADDPVFRSRKLGGRLTERAVNFVLKRAAAEAGIDPRFSAHWLRHAHASHAIDHGAPMSVVQATLGHGNIAVTSGYLHARPGDSSGLHLDEGVFLR
jgi:integrase/recombinase XerD